MDAEIYEQDDFEKPKREQTEDDVYYGTPMDDEPPRRRSGRWPLYVILGCLLSCFACCVLPFCALAIAGVGIAAVLENTEVTETNTETIKLETDDLIMLEVDNRVGDITVRRGSSDEVEVEYTKRAHGFTQGQAENELDRIDVSVSQPSVDKVAVIVELDNDEDTFFSFSNEVDMTIRVPEELYIEVETNVGTVQIDGLDARSLVVRTNTGDIEFDGQLGVNPNNTFSLQTNVGDITLRLPDSTYEIDPI